MGDVLIYALCQNIFIFSCIFWILTWAGEYFFKNKKHTAKRYFYECGFKSVKDSDLQININFSIICVFLILYDVEFTMLIPMVINYQYVESFTLLILIAFIALIIGSLEYDFQTNSLSWQIM